jgi:hypothetical protein
VGQAGAQPDKRVVPVGDMSPLGLSFCVEVDASSELAHDERRADALITVSARSAAESAGPQAPPAEVLIMDRSLSMAGRGKLDEAKRAMCQAIDTLRDGTRLGIIAGHHQAEVIYPAGGGLAVVDAAAKEEAKNRVAGQLAEGGTAIGQWLARADRLFASMTSADTVRHAVLYTDGKDEHETPEELGAVLAACTDRFVCDARGLGEDWDYTELLRITEALHGSAEAVVTVRDLTQDFIRLMQQAQRIVVARVYLGLHLNGCFQLGFVRQTLPVEADLTVRQRHDNGEIHIPLGSWSPQDRQYQMSLRFDPEDLPVDEELRAARITLHAELPDGTRAPCSEMLPMLVRRRSTPGFRTPLPDGITRVENMRELGMAMRACADAQLRGEFERADRELRIAIQLAGDLRQTAQLQLLRSLSVTGPDGRPRVRRTASPGELQRLGLVSKRTAAPPADEAQPAPVGGTRQCQCPRCGKVTSGRSVRFCEVCGHRFDDPAANGAPVDAL